MHIPDGFVPPAISITGYAITGGVTWYTLRKIQKESNPTEKIPKASLLTAAFFVTSFISIPIPPTSIHLILNGLMGIILGYYAFLAILIGLFFQAAIFFHGGISTLGVNAVMMGVPALLAHHLYQWGLPWTRKRAWFGKVLPFLVGAGTLALSATIFVLVVLNTIPVDIDGQREQQVIYASLAGYGIQTVLEGVFTGMVVNFLRHVKPELLESG